MAVLSSGTPVIAAGRRLISAAAGAVSPLPAGLPGHIRRVGVKPPIPLFAAVEDAKLANLVVLTGDVHNHWAGELKKNFDDPRSATLGVEFGATSISSGGDGFETNDTFQALLAQNPHIKFFNSQRGYVRHVVTPDRWQADFQVLDKVSVPDGHVSTRKSCVVEHGKSGLADA